MILVTEGEIFRNTLKMVRRGQCNLVGEMTKAMRPGTKNFL